MNNPRPPAPRSPTPRPPRKRARLLYGAAGSLAAALLWGLPTPPAASAPPPGHASVRTADLHYLVSGLPSADNLLWADRLAAQEKALSKWIGRTVPFGNDPPIAVSFRTRADGIEPVVRIQGWEDGRFLQRLAAPGVWGIDADDFDEAACWLLLNRCAAGATPPEFRYGMGAETPDWLACGLARDLDSALRARTRDWIARDWREGRAMPLADIVKLSRLPSGQWREKAYAAAAVEFLLPSGDAAAWQALFDALARRETPTARWFRAHSPALAGKDESPETLWRAWLARTAAAADSAAGAGRRDRSLAQEALLMDILTCRPRETDPGVPADIPAEVYARDLAAWRGQPWCTRLATRLLVRVQELAPTAPDALRDAIAAYASYFAQLATPPAPERHWWQRGGDDDDSAAPRPPDDAAWSLALNQLWQRAERLHRDFLETTLARKQYLDLWDARSRPLPDDTPPDAPDEAPLPRTPIQRYLDRFEPAY